MTDRRLQPWPKWDQIEAQLQIMAKVGQTDLLHFFRKIDLQSVNWLIPTQKLEGLISEVPMPPQNSKPAEDDPNSLYIPAKALKKKKDGKMLANKNPKYAGHAWPDKTNHVSHAPEHQASRGPDHHEQRQKVYKPGPFALFYELQKGVIEKEKEVWFYKENKEVIGPTSSYNMDKMVYFKTIEEDTKVAFETTDKFVKFKKIKSIIKSQSINKKQE